MSRLLRFGAAAFALGASITLANCTNGVTNTTPIASTSASPEQATTTIPAAGGSLDLAPAANGQTVSFAVAAGAPAGTSITTAVSAAAPVNAPAPSSLHRAAESISGAVPFLFVTFSVSQTAPATIFASESVLLLASFPSSAAYYVEFDDVTSSPATKLACAGPAGILRLTATIANNIGFGACATNHAVGALTFLAGHAYLVQFYYVPGTTPTAPASSSPSPSASASASPSPSASPTPTPAPAPGALAVTTSSLFFTGSSPAPQTFTASQSAFGGTFTTTDTCAGFATVSGSSPTFTVTATAAPATASTAPTCTVTVSNGIGGTAAVNVYISTVGVIVNSRGRR